MYMYVIAWCHRYCFILCRILNVFVCTCKIMYMYVVAKFFCVCDRSSLLQVMVNSAVSGVAFSRHPLKPISSNAVFIEAVYGLGEGLVSGELEADRYEVRGDDIHVPGIYSSACVIVLYTTIL